MAVGWVLWKIRNDLVFSNIIIKSPKQVAYRIIGFLNQWTKMEKTGGAQKEKYVKELLDGLARW